MIYIASPYTARMENGDVNEALQHKRFIETCLACGELMVAGKLVYSPIAHWHIIDQLTKGRIQHEDYLAADVKMIELCREVHVFKLAGWDESKGVLLEIEYAKLIAKKPICYFTMDEQGIHYETLS